MKMSLVFLFPGCLFNKFIMEMDYSNIEDLLISYYDGKATADEVREIEAWIKSSDGNKRRLLTFILFFL